MKGERNVTFTVNIRLHPEEDSENTASLTDEDFMEFPVLLDSKKSSKDKTNLVHVKFKKLDELTHNPEAFIKLWKDLELNKWSKEAPDKVTIYEKIEDLRLCMTGNALRKHDEIYLQVRTHIVDESENQYQELLDRNAFDEDTDSDDEGGQWESAEHLWPTIFDLGHAEGSQHGLRIFTRQQVIEQPRSFKNWLDHDMVYPVAMKANERRFKTEAEMEKGRKWFADYYFHELAQIIFKEPYDAYRLQMNYLTGHAIKAWDVKFRDFQSRMETLFSYLKYFPAASRRNSHPTMDSIATRDKPIHKDVIRLAIFNGLPEAWKVNYHQSHSEDIRDLKPAEFNSIIIAYEDNDEAKKPRAQDKSPGKSNPKDNKNQKGKPKPSNESGGGKFCKYCEKQGRPETVCKTHNEDKCFLKRNHEKAKASTDRDKKFAKLEKQVLSLQKKLKRKRGDNGSISESDDSNE
jgi:hypothetical protein